MEASLAFYVRVVLFISFLAVSSAELLEAAAIYPLNGLSKFTDITGKSPAGKSTVEVTLAEGPYNDPDGAYYFAGNANSYIEIPRNASLNTRYFITILAWVYHEGQSGPIFQYRRNNWGYHFWFTAPNQLFVRPQKKGALFVNAQVYNGSFAGAWHLVGATYDNATGNSSLWVDGKMVVQEHLGTYELDTDAEIRIGARLNDNRYFKGRISCVQIYDKALTEEQINSVKYRCRVLPKILFPLQDMFIEIGERLELSCNTSGDPAAHIAWTKDNSQLPARALLDNNNSTLIINSVVLGDDGRYTCVATNRQGNTSSSSTVEVQARQLIHIPRPHTLTLRNYTINITVDCYGYGKPLPAVVWKKDGKEIKNVSEFSGAYSNQVVQLFEFAKPSQWNVTSRLYLRAAGITYKESGIYTCEVFNGVGTNRTTEQSVEVLFVPQFTERPKDRVVIQGQNVTFPCKFSGVPKPSVVWNFSGGSLPRHSIKNWDLTLFGVSNTERFEGSYTCAASSRAGFSSSVARLVVDDKPKPEVCPKENKDGVDWSSTNQGSRDVKPCPAPATGKVVRACLKRSGDAVWDATNFVNCTSKQYVDLGKEARALVEGSQTNRSAPEILEVLTNITKPTQNNEGKPDEVYGGDIKISVQILEYLAEFNSGKGNGSLSNPGNQKKFLLAASNLLEETNVNTWRQLDEEDNGFSTILVDTLDNYGLSVAVSLDGEGNKSYALVDTPNIVMRMDNVGHNNQIKTDGLLFAHEKSKIFLPPEVFRSTDSNRVASFIYLTLHEILSFNKSNMAGGQSLSGFSSSIIVSSTVDPSPPRQLRSLVKIDLEKKEDPPDTTPLRSCVFWRVGLPRKWHTDGCRLVAGTSDDVITCECNHLTMFSSLMDPYGEPRRAKISRDLEIISLLGCIISTVAILLTVGVTLFLWRFMKKPRTQTVVLLNLCAAIAITCTLVIGESWARDYEARCTVVAALLHFSLLAMFSWMLCEGILLYIAVMKMTVGGAQETPKYFYAIGWGFPAIVVAVSLGTTQTAGYGTADICWLSIDSGLIWAFIGPASAVILVNIVVFILVHRERASTRTERNKNRVDKIHSGIRASAVILPILGVTWVFGLLGFNVDTLAFKYIFTILNSLQGLLIFIFHCVLNRKIHDAIKRWADERKKIKDQRLTIGSKRRRRDNELRMEPVGEEKAAVSQTNLSDVKQE